MAVSRGPVEILIRPASALGKSGGRGRPFSEGSA